METILLSVGCESLLVALCISTSYGSWTELQQSLTIIGCSSLFFCAVLHFASSSSSSAASSSKNTQSLATNPPRHTAQHTPSPSTARPPSEAVSPPKEQPVVEQPESGAMHSLDTTLSSLSPLPSLGLSPSKSVSKQRVIRTPRASVSPSKPKTAAAPKHLLSTSSAQDLQPLLHREPGTAPSNRSTAPLKMAKRTDYLDWTDYFLSVAMLSAMRSKDPSTQVGACIVNEEKRIVGIGYNGFPKGCGDDELPWNRSSEKGENDTKYPYVCHAEMNAIMNKNSSSCRDCTMYVVLFPCNDCAKLVIQAGIRRVVYISDKYARTSSVIASKRLFAMAGVQCTQYVPRTKSVLIKFPLPEQ